MAYQPPNIPNVSSQEDLMRWVVDEFKKVAEAASETTALDLRPVHAEPLRPREGMIVFADGTNWDPGAGIGVYSFINGAWSKL